MISFLEGILEQINPNSVVINVSGIGYEVFTSQKDKKNFPPLGSLLKLFCYLQVKENGYCLYGFVHIEERDLFLKLISVSGLGPKSGLAILSVFSPQEIVKIIKNEKIQQFLSVPGIGRKTAERIILELKDKIPLIPQEDSIFKDAFSALKNLGYKQQEIDCALKKVEKFYEETWDLERLVKEILKVL